MCVRITLTLSRCVVIVAALCQQMQHAEGPATYGSVVETQMDVPIRRIVPEATRTSAARTVTRSFPMANWPGDEPPDGIFPAPALRLGFVCIFVHFLCTLVQKIQE